MGGTEYPKIETLFNRGEDFKVRPENGVRLPEFDIPERWLITEKVDGTNIRIEYTGPDYDPPEREPGRVLGGVQIKGRTDNADIPPSLLDTLQEMFSVDKFAKTFGQDVFAIIYGEGYGARIQKGGGSYREGTGFRVFDVKVGPWWLNWADVCDVSEKMGIKTVPAIKAVGLWDAVDMLNPVTGFIESTVAIEDGGEGRMPEGIVARTDPLLFMRSGDRLSWKLKHKELR